MTSPTPPPAPDESQPPQENIPTGLRLASLLAWFFAAYAALGALLSATSSRGLIELLLAIPMVAALYIAGRDLREKRRRGVYIIAVVWILMAVGGSLRGRFSFEPSGLMTILLVVAAYHWRLLR